MKIRSRTFVSSALILAGLLSAQSIMAEPVQSSATLQANLKSVSMPEIPAKAAELVRTSTPAQQEATAIAVTQSAVALAPGAASEIVGAIVRQAPATAPAVAAAAVSASPRKAVAITRAAAVAAPKQAGKIVSSVCKKQPAQFAAIAMEVVRALPSAGDSVLAGLVDALPNLKPYMERATVLAAANGAAFSSAQKVLTYLSALVEKSGTTTVFSPQLATSPSLGVEAPVNAQAPSAVTVVNTEIPGVPGYSKPADSTADDIAAKRANPRWRDYSGP